MGVKRLYQIVKYFAKDCVNEKSFKDYRGTVQALDASIIIYKFCIAILNTEHYKKYDVAFENKSGKIIKIENEYRGPFDKIKKYYFSFSLTLLFGLLADFFCIKD